MLEEMFDGRILVAAAFSAHDRGIHLGRHSRVEKIRTFSVVGFTVSSADYLHHYVLGILVHTLAQD